MAQRGLANVSKARLDELIILFRSFLVSSACCTNGTRKKVRGEMSKLNGVIIKQTRRNKDPNPIICLSNSFLATLFDLEDTILKSLKKIPKQSQPNEEVVFERNITAMTGGIPIQKNYFLNPQI